MFIEDKSLKLTPARISACQRLSLKTTDDVLQYYPFRYEVNETKPFTTWEVRDKVTFEGRVVSKVFTFRRGRMSSSSFEVMMDDTVLKITIYNRPWASQLSDGTVVTIHGIYQGKNRVTAISYDTKPLAEHPAVVPVYSLKEGMRQSTIRAVIQKVFEAVENQITDDVPETFIHRYRLLRKRDALYRIHFPESMHDVNQAVRTLKYSEFLQFFTSVIHTRQKETETYTKPAKRIDTEKIRDVILSLPYRLTVDQLSALNEILKDMSTPKPMYRLVQGDVGCGKTAVAVLALYGASIAGYQGALLAPTEILARQHLESIQTMLGNRVRCALLYSGLSKNEKAEVLEQIRSGSVDIVVGTHALLQENVSFSRLGLVVTDEQQRFGVEQRRALARKGDACDFLLMSATPIPRTLASAMFGEMNVSTIHTMPAGRQAPDTVLINENSFRSVLSDVQQLLAEGRQLYIICAAVEEGDSEVRNVETVTKNIARLFPQYHVDCLSGPMKSEQKEAVMKAFGDNTTQILVSTTVVEVGMNVVNATGMIVYNAERFGLSQLHQLRGRIQRGSTKGKCWLLTNAKEPSTLSRLKVLVKSCDGFEISQEDLRQRGPGDILGTRQSGIPDFILGNLDEDTAIIETARKDAQYICDHPDHPDFASILDRAATRYMTQYTD
ncbi:MAG: ATP-dependent DNA helicase RecG [Bulleidia sp.]